MVMKKFTKIDLLCAIIVPIIVLTSAVVIPKGFDSILWNEEERTEAIRYNNSVASQISEYRICDDEVIVCKKADNKWLLIPKLPFYGGIVNALKYDVDYQILLCVIALSLIYIVLVTCLFKITSFWIWIICVGYGIFQWLSESYTHIGFFDVYSTSVVALILMVTWTTYGLYKQGNETNETKTGLIGAWKMLSEDGSQNQEWFFQNSCKLLISGNGVVKEYSWKKLTGKDSIAISDSVGNIVCCDYKKTDEYNLVSDEMLYIARNLFVKQPTEIKSVSELKQKIEDKKHQHALAERLHRLYKTRYIIYKVLRFSLFLLFFILVFFDVNISLPDITGNHHWDFCLYIIVPCFAWVMFWDNLADRLSVDGFTKRIENRKTGKEKRRNKKNVIPPPIPK